VVAAALLLPGGSAGVAGQAAAWRGRWPRLERVIVPGTVLVILMSSVPRALDRAGTVERLKVFVGFGEMKTEPNGYEYRWLEPNNFINHLIMDRFG
jgi:hypothetical protein